MIGVRTTFDVLIIYLRSNSLINLKVYLLSLQTTPNPISLFNFSLKVAQRELGKNITGEWVSNENHKANSLAFQYCHKKSFILGITTVIANSNQQNLPLKTNTGLN